MFDDSLGIGLMRIVPPCRAPARRSPDARMRFQSHGVTLSMAQGLSSGQITGTDPEPSPG